jgi:hypothetical protein
MTKEVKRNELIHVQFEKDDRCIDMLLTQSEIEKGVARALDTKNYDLLCKNCCTCWPVEKPPKCNFWDRLMFKCSSK